MSLLDTSQSHKVSLIKRLPNTDPKLKHRFPVDGEGVSPYYGMGANGMLSGS